MVKGPLKDWAESLLNENKLHQQGFLDEKYVRDRWNEHINGKYNWGHQLWNILMFQSWLDHTRISMSTIFHFKLNKNENIICC